MKKGKPKTAHAWVHDGMVVKVGIMGRGGPYRVDPPRPIKDFPQEDGWFATEKLGSGPDYILVLTRTGPRPPAKKRRSLRRHGPLTS